MRSDSASKALLSVLLFHLILCGSGSLAPFAGALPGFCLKCRAHDDCEKSGAGLLRRRPKAGKRLARPCPKPISGIPRCPLLAVRSQPARPIVPVGIKKDRPLTEAVSSESRLRSADSSGSAIEGRCRFQKPSAVQSPGVCRAVVDEAEGSVPSILADTFTALECAGDARGRR